MNTGLFTRLAGNAGAAPRRIQRACDCGGRPAQGGECEQCRKKRVQRRGEGSAAAAGSGAARAGVDAARKK